MGKWNICFKSGKKGLRFKEPNMNQFGAIN